MDSKPIATSWLYLCWLSLSMFSDYSECSSILTWKIQSFYVLMPVLYWFLQGSHVNLTKSIAFSSKKWSPNEPTRANLRYPSPCLICFTRPTRIKRALSYDFLMRCGHFLWISLDFLWISLDFFGLASNSSWFLDRCGRFLWISLDFRWISLDFYVPVVAVELLHISWDLVRRSAAEHARAVHDRASQKLHENVLISVDFHGFYGIPIDSSNSHWCLWVFI